MHAYESSSTPSPVAIEWGITTIITIIVVDNLERK